MFNKLVDSSYSTETKKVIVTWLTKVIREQTEITDGQSFVKELGALFSNVKAGNPSSGNTKANK